MVSSLCLSLVAYRAGVCLQFPQHRATTNISNLPWITCELITRLPQQLNLLGHSWRRLQSHQALYQCLLIWLTKTYCVFLCIGYLEEASTCIKNTFHSAYKRSLCLHSVVITLVIFWERKYNHMSNYHEKVETFTKSFVKPKINKCSVLVIGVRKTQIDSS